MIIRTVALLLATVCAGLAVADVSRAVETPPDRMHAERARPVDDFLDSIGVNVHLSYHDTPYGNEAAIISLVRSLGVRHVRDGVALGQTDVCHAARAMAQNGTHFDYLISPKLGRTELEAWASCAGPAIEAYEGLNEYDISHDRDPNWVQTEIDVQRALYQNVKDDPALRNLLVIGPSLTSPAAYRAVGDLSTSMDVGNMHNYFAGHEPGTGGWGLGGYGSISYNLTAARVVSASHPMFTTETGYSSGPDPRAVDLGTQATYVPDLYLEQFAAGIPRTYYYELVDEGGTPFSHYGLIDSALRPKPAYTALASLLAVLGGSPQSTASGPDQLPTVAFAVDGANDAVRHLILARRDGTLFVIVWRSDPAFDTLTQRPLNDQPIPVTVRVSGHYRNVTDYAYDSGGTLRPTDVTKSAAAVPLRASIRAQVLRYVPLRLQ